MQDRNIIGGIMATLTSICIDSVNSLVPYLLFAIVLICVDCRFGVRAARMRGEVIRFSKMWRRSINKFVDYVCWIGIAAFFGQTFGKVVLGIPLTSFMVLIIVYCIELGSCFNNYFEANGINMEFNIAKFFKKSNIDFVEDKDKDKGVK